MLRSALVILQLSRGVGAAMPRGFVRYSTRSPVTPSDGCCIAATSRIEAIIGTVTRTGGARVFGVYGDGAYNLPSDRAPLLGGMPGSVADRSCGRHGARRCPLRLTAQDGAAPPCCVLD